MGSPIGEPQMMAVCWKGKLQLEIKTHYKYIERCWLAAPGTELELYFTNCWTRIPRIQ